MGIITHTQRIHSRENTNIEYSSDCLRKNQCHKYLKCLIFLVSKMLSNNRYKLKYMQGFLIQHMILTYYKNVLLTKNNDWLLYYKLNYLL